MDFKERLHHIVEAVRSAVHLLLVAVVAWARGIMWHHVASFVSKLPGVRVQHFCFQVGQAGLEMAIQL